MKKNKTIAYALAAILLVGGTFAGTKAWFTDKEVVDNTLNITTGTLDLDVTDKGWYRNGNETEDFTKLVPGDVISRKIEVANNSNINNQVVVTKEESKLSDAEKSAIDNGFININDGNFKEEVEKLKGNGDSVIVEFKATIGVGNGSENGVDNGFQENEFNLGNMLGKYSITTEQTDHR